MNARKFNDRLREIREDRDITQKFIANYLGITQASYSRYETGVHQPDIDSLIKISDCLNVSISYLIGDSKVTNLVIEKLAEYGLISTDATDEELDLTLKKFKKLVELENILRDMNKL